MYKLQDMLPNSPHSDVKSTPDVYTSPAEIPESSTTSGAGLLDASHKAFATDGLEDFYIPIEKYEGRHRYDPKFQWDSKEEKRVVRKVLSIPTRLLLSVLY